MAPYRRFWDDAADVLAQAWHARGRRRASLRAAVALALSFETHRTLVREQHLAGEQAIELMVRFVASAAMPEPTR